MLGTAPILGELRKRVLGRRPTPRGAAASPLFDDVRQVCTVARDFETTVSNLVEHLGIGPFRCWHFRPPRLYGTTYRGERERYSMKLAITWLDDVQWEVITPVDGRTLYRDHLEAHGDGVQHLLMSTGETPFETAAVHLKERGHPFGQTAKLNAAVQLGRFTLPSPPNRVADPISLQFGYVDAEATLRTSIELTRYPLGLSERFSLRSGKPESCVPADKPDFERGLPERRVGSLVKITIVTRDLDATIRSWIDLAGVGPWRVHERRGEPRVARTVLGQACIEIVEPGDNRGPHRDALEARGEVVASLGVLPGRAGFDALVARCTELGYTPELRRPLVGDHPAVYFGARRFIGTDIEVLEPRERELARWIDKTRPERVVDAR